MTRVGKWLRDFVERQLDRFYEGPSPPRRLEDMVNVFANMNPRATRAEWAAFAAAHARESYKSGWTRGLEYTERMPEERRALREADPEKLADAMNPDWRWMAEPVELEEPRVVPRDTDRTEAEELRELLRQTRDLSRKGES